MRPRSVSAETFCPARRRLRSLTSSFCVTCSREQVLPRTDKQAKFTTSDVVERIVKTKTQQAKCRYVELEDVRPHVWKGLGSGEDMYFISHGESRGRPALHPAFVRVTTPPSQRPVTTAARMLLRSAAGELYVLGAATAI